MIAAVALALSALTGAAAAQDSYEPDDAFPPATVLVPGAQQQRTFHTPGDVDWVVFSATANQQVFVSTTELGFGVDTVVL